MEIMIESMMVAERGEFMADSPGNKGNGYRPGSGQGRKLEFRIPRDRYGNFHPQILAILRDQEEECDRLTGVIYTKGLTQEQVGDVFDQICAQHYSKASISRMVECVRTQVNEWLERGLEEYYPCGVRRLCSHQDSPYAVCGSRGVLCGIGRDRGRYTRSSWHLQHAAGKCDRLGEISLTE